MAGLAPTLAHLSTSTRPDRPPLRVDGFVGKGKRLFHEGTSNKPLVLVDSKALDAGVLSLTYKRATE